MRVDRPCVRVFERAMVENLKLVRNSSMKAARFGRDITQNMTCAVVATTVYHPEISWRAM
mgnify:CR=1 FL=1